MKLNKFALCSFIASFVIASQAQATGIPTADAVQATNMLQQYKQSLEDMANQVEQLSTQIKQYEQQVLQYKQQMLDAAKPVTDLYKSISDLYNIGNSLYNDANSIYQKATDASNFINENYGSKAFWENCVLTGCDPTSQLQKAFADSSRASQEVLADSVAITKRTAQNMDDLNSMAQGLKDESGTNALLQRNAEITAKVGTVLADATQRDADEAAAKAREKLAAQAFIQAQAAGIKSRSQLNQKTVSKNIALLN